MIVCVDDKYMSCVISIKKTWQNFIYKDNSQETIHKKCIDSAKDGKYHGNKKLKTSKDKQVQYKIRPIHDDEKQN